MLVPFVFRVNNFIVIHHYISSNMHLARLSEISQAINRAVYYILFVLALFKYISFIILWEWDPLPLFMYIYSLWNDRNKTKVLLLVFPLSNRGYVAYSLKAWTYEKFVILLLITDIRRDGCYIAVILLRGQTWPLLYCCVTSGCWLWFWHSFQPACTA